MPGPIYHVGNTAMCPHGGKIISVPTSPRVQVTGSMPIGTMADVYTVVGCPFNVSGSPHPCVIATWVAPAVRVTSMGVPVILQTSAGICAAPDGAPQGSPVVPVNQPRAIAT